MKKEKKKKKKRLLYLNWTHALLIKIVNVMGFYLDLSWTMPENHLNGTL